MGPKGGGTFCDTKYKKKYVSCVETGMGMGGQIICIERCTLDVISSVSRSSKCTKIVVDCGFRPPGGADSASPYPVAGFRGPTFKGLTSKKEGRGREEKGGEAPK